MLVACSAAICLAATGSRLENDSEPLDDDDGGGGSGGLPWKGDCGLFRTRTAGQSQSAGVARKVAKDTHSMSSTALLTSTH